MDGVGDCCRTCADIQKADFAANMQLGFTANARAVMFADTAFKSIHMNFKPTQEDSLMRSIATILLSLFLLLPQVVVAQDRICEKFGGGRIITEFVCPAGYIDMGTVGVPSTSNRSQSNSMEIYQEMINRNETDRQARLAREAAAAEAQRQRNDEARQAAERKRQRIINNSNLDMSARCFEGAWIIKNDDNSAEMFDLDITRDGKVFVAGNLVNGDPTATLMLANNTLNITVTEGNQSFSQRLRLDGERLVGNLTVTRVEKGFWKDKKLPPEEFRVQAVRTSAAPTECVPTRQSSVTSSAVSRGESIADGLKNLSELHSQGILTEEEFSAAKRRLLGL